VHAARQQRQLQVTHVRPRAWVAARVSGPPPIALLALLLGCGPAVPERPADTHPSSGSDAVDMAPSDSLRLSLGVPVEVAAGVSVPVTITLENVSGRPLDLYLRGRTIAFDIVVLDAAGVTTWRRLEGVIIPAILRLESLAPGQVLELSDRWDQRDNAGRPVGAGDYSVYGEVLTEGPPLRTADVPLRILP
jgi:hypothetical protein